MKRSWILALVPLLFVFGLTASAGGREPSIMFARLVPLNEVPAVISNGSGFFRARIADDDTSIAFEVNFSSLTADVVQGHIHVGEPFTSGGISAFFCGGGAQPACPTGPSGTFTGTITAANMDPRANGQGVTQGDFAALLTAIRRGATYANLHSAKFLAGEVRGQIFAF